MKVMRYFPERGTFGIVGGLIVVPALSEKRQPPTHALLGARRFAVTTAAREVQGLDRDRLPRVGVNRFVPAWR